MFRKFNSNSLMNLISKCAIAVITASVSTQAFPQVATPILEPILIGAATGPQTPVGAACEIIVVGYAACNIAYKFSNLCIAPVVDGVVTWCMTDNDDPRYAEPIDDEGKWKVIITLPQGGTIAEPIPEPKKQPGSYQDCRDNVNQCIRSSDRDLRACLELAGVNTKPNLKEIQNCYDAERERRKNCSEDYLSCIKKFPPPAPRADPFDTEVHLPVIQATPDDK